MAPAADPAAGALDDRATRELRRYRRRAWAWLGGGLALFVAFAVAASIVEGGAAELERSGARVPGVVAEIRSLGEGGSIVVGFSWDERQRREVVRLDAESPRYTEGQSVTVVVDRRHPDRVSIPGETNQSTVTVLPMIIALVASVAMLIIGFWGLARGSRQRRHLRRTSWRRVGCRYAEIPCGRSVRGILLLREGGSSDPILTLASLARWRLRSTGFRQTAEVDVAGDPTGYVVLRSPDGATLVSARPPMTKGAARRWRRALDRRAP